MSEFEVREVFRVLINKLILNSRVNFTVREQAIINLNFL